MILIRQVKQIKNKRGRVGGIVVQRLVTCQILIQPYLLRSISFVLLSDLNHPSRPCS